MCTLLFGRDVLGPGTLLVSANRDEDPARPSDPPAQLSAAPYVVGGRDRGAGGTWLAIREGRAVVALLNRRGAPDVVPGADLRSRGLLALDVACAADGGDALAFPDAALAVARAAIRALPYAPFSLACVTPERGWLLVHDGLHAAEPRDIGPGWHVLTHADLDDSSEPRAVRLRRKLDGYRPTLAGEAETRVLELLSLHGSFGDGAPDESDAASATGDPDRAAVCIHSGHMVTVSTSLFRLTPAGARYIHIEGRPCTTPPRDLSSLLAPAH